MEQAVPTNGEWWHLPMNTCRMSGVTEVLPAFFEKKIK